jgi:hypothetical protein
VRPHGKPAAGKSTTPRALETDELRFFALMIAESPAKEKDAVIRIVVNLISKRK